MKKVDREKNLGDCCRESSFAMIHVTNCSDVHVWLTAKCSQVYTFLTLICLVRLKNDAQYLCKLNITILNCKKDLPKRNLICKIKAFRLIEVPVIKVIVHTEPPLSRIINNVLKLWILRSDYKMAMRNLRYLTFDWRWPWCGQTQALSSNCAINSAPGTWRMKNPMRDSDYQIPQARTSGTCSCFGATRTSATTATAAPALSLLPWRANSLFNQSINKPLLLNPQSAPKCLLLFEGHRTKIALQTIQATIHLILKCGDDGSGVRHLRHHDWWAVASLKP